MSYAKVASTDIPLLSQQPKPNVNLLNTDAPTATVVDDTAKVSLAPPDFKQNPHTITSETIPIRQYATPGEGPAKKSKKQKATEEFERAEERSLYFWHRLQDKLLRPGVAGGLVGLVNIGLLAGAGYQFYSRPALRSDAKVIGSTVAGALVLLGAEGAAAEAYRKTEAGRAEEARAREEGAALYKHTKNIVLRPGVLGGLAGVINIGILGTIGYFAYENWDLPRWDRKTVSVITIGLLGLWAGEGYLAEEYKEKEYPKRK